MLRCPVRGQAYKTQSRGVSNSYDHWRACKRPSWIASIRFCSDLPIFVVHCTKPSTFHFLSTEEEDPGASRLPARNNL